MCVRINTLESVGYIDLQSVMHARPDIVAYPKASGAFHIRALAVAIATHEAALGIERGAIEILPVCETALGVVNLREMAGASARVRCALLGAEDLAADLCAERTREAVELDYARGRFVLECRAAAIEPVDAPYTFSDSEGAAQEARRARRLGYRTKAVVRPEQVRPVRDALVPSPREIAYARKVVAEFEAARGRGEDRTLVANRWLNQIYEPIMALVPKELRGKLEPAEIYHEILEHRWFLSERAGHEVDLFETARDYIDTVLSKRPNEVVTDTDNPDVLMPPTRSWPGTS